MKHLFIGTKFSTTTISSVMTKLAKLLTPCLLLIVLFYYLTKDMLPNDHIQPSLKGNHNLQLLSDVYPQLTPMPVLTWDEAEQHLIYFFAPWCTICALSQPSLEAFSRLKPQIKISMIALDWESSDSVLTFKNKHGYQHNILLGNDSIKQQWQVDAYPSYYFVDKLGQITSKDRGLVTLPGLLARAW